MSYTPGPWHSSQLQTSFGIYNEFGDVVAKVPAMPIVSMERKQADARLIASAPTLLETLKALVESAEFSACVDDSNPSLWKTIESARAAIAKAEGAK